MGVKMRSYNIFPLFVVILSEVVCTCLSFLFAKENVICKNMPPNEHMWGISPLKLTSKLLESSSCPYAHDIVIELCIRDEDLCQTMKIEIQHTQKQTIPITIIRKGKRNKCSEQIKNETMVVKCPHKNHIISAWKLEVHIRAELHHSVSVSFRNYSATVRDRPQFNMSVDRSARSVNVMVNPGPKVYTRLCYGNLNSCTGLSSHTTIDPSSSQSAILNFPYLLPCLCVEACYTCNDAPRNRKCPFMNEPLEIDDIWHSSNVTLSTKEDNLVTWVYKCCKHYLKPSASLCWKQQANTCTPVLNSSLSQIDYRYCPTYNVSGLDKHPQMCVQLSLNGSHFFYCPFTSDMSTWEADIEPGRRTVFVSVTSSNTATYCAQLCVLNKSGCLLTGLVTTVKVDGKMSAKLLVDVPLHLITDRTCVQVWRSDPAQHGRRILCLENTHRRLGMYAVAVLVFAVIVAILGFLAHQVAKMGAAGWLSIQKPVLLVCSSESSGHVSAVYTMASLLQRELCATVRLAQWSQVSETHTGTGGGPGLADMGPLPWLYGQWEAVHKAEGKVLIIWSPDAKVSYDKWREERVESSKKKKRKDDYIGLREELEDWKENRRRGEKVSKVKPPETLTHSDNTSPQTEFSSITGPVFMAALACIQGVLQERGNHSGVVLAYFQGLGHRKDIPKDLRVFPRYCLPQDFGDLVQELGGTVFGTQSAGFGRDCWPRHLSKALSLWLAQRLAYRLGTLLPQTDKASVQASLVTLSPDVMPDGTRGVLNLPLLPNMATVGTVQKQEAPHTLLWR